MFARVIVVDGWPEKVEDGAKTFGDVLVPTAKRVEGYKGAFFLVDRRTGSGIGVTLWATEEAREEAGEIVGPAREATVEAMGAGKPLPAEYEVAFSDFG